jgi:SAM-dependent methyltransferase
MKTRAPGDFDWRDRLYDSYVSSGQANLEVDGPASAFAPRAPWIRAVVRRHVPADPATRILDLGCGHGALLFVLRQMGYRNVTGVDVSREQVRAAGRMGIDGVELADALGYVQKLGAESVDVVVAVDLLEHLPSSQLLDLAQGVHRILRPGGRWVIHVPNAEGLFGPGVRYGDLTHQRAFTPSSIGQLCRAGGFTRVDVYPDRPVVHGPASLFRRVVWTFGVLPLRLLFAAETGQLSPVLTRNLLTVAHRQAEWVKGNGSLTSRMELPKPW